MRTSIGLFIALLATAPLAAQDVAVVGPASSGIQLRPGDILQVIVWGNEQYSGQFKVDENWQIQYPVIGDINVRDKTMAQIREELRDGLLQIFNNPFVTVSPNFNIAVLGEVRQPGLFPVDPTLTVLDIIAMAGGASPDGNINSTRLMRGGETMDLRFERDRVGARTLQDVGLQSGDQIYVPRKAFTAGDLQTLLSIVQIGLSIAILISTN